MKLLSLATALASLGLGAPAAASPPPATSLMAPSVPAVGHGWEAKLEDNICGIADLKKVSRPALLDYEEVWKATPQIKKLEKEGIDPDSAEGKALRQAARSLITKSAQTVRKDCGYCSVWKAIAHKDKRDIPDISEEVIELF